MGTAFLAKGTVCADALRQEGACGVEKPRQLKSQQERAPGLAGVSQIIATVKALD